jgi:hypothetical protein
VHLEDMMMKLSVSLDTTHQYFVEDALGHEDFKIHS